jgi:hypothetical protein
MVVPEQLICAVNQMNVQGAPPRTTLYDRQRINQVGIGSVLALARLNRMTDVCSLGLRGDKQRHRRKAGEHSGCLKGSEGRGWALIDADRIRPLK